MPAYFVGVLWEFTRTTLGNLLSGDGSLCTDIIYC